MQNSLTPPGATRIENGISEKYSFTRRLKQQHAPGPQTTPAPTCSRCGTLIAVRCRSPNAWQNSSKWGTGVGRGKIFQRLARVGRYKGKMTGHGFRALATTTNKERLAYGHEVADRQLARFHRCCKRQISANGRTQ